MLIVIIFFSFVGFNCWSIFFILFDFSWKILVVFFLFSSLKVFWLLNGIWDSDSFWFIFCLIFFKIWFKMVKLCKFKKFIFKSLMFCRVFIGYWVRYILLCFFCIVIDCVSGFLLIIMFVVCVEVCFGSFFIFMVMLYYCFLVLFLDK